MRVVTQRIASWWARHERVVGWLSLVGGFLFDLFLATGPESITDNILLISYLLLAATIIVLLNIRSRVQMERKSLTEPLLLLFVLQFCFGGLASNLIILYGRSGTWGSSALFIALLVAFIFGNEFLKNRYAKLQFNVAVYYFLLLAYVTIAIPTFFLHAVGVGVFVVSGIVSLVIIALFLAAMYVFVFKRKQTRHMWEVSVLVLVIFLIFNSLYFLNIIPPVPLSLKEGGMYHTIARERVGTYVATYEPAAWYAFWRITSSTYTSSGQDAYCFSAVYAPSNLSTSIIHRWEQYDDISKKWETRSLVSFRINGGREGGYRGWSNKAGLTAGSWRCNVETERGQLIGRISFTVVEALTTPALSTTKL